MASLQFKAFRERFSDLVEGVKLDIDRIASEAYSKGLITPSTRQTVSNYSTDITTRSTSLVSAIHGQVGVSEEAFGVFLEILRKEPAISTLGDTLEDTLLVLESRSEQRTRKMEGKGAGSGGADGGASVMEADSGIGANSTPSVPTNGEVAPQGAELASLHHSLYTRNGPGVSQPDCGTGKPLTIQDRQEVGVPAGGNSLVAASQSLMPRVGSSSSVSSLEDKYHLRMELAQKDAMISELEYQGDDLRKRLDKSQKEIEDAQREKEDVVMQLKSKEADLQRVTKQKDKEIQCLQDEIKKKEGEIAEHEHRFAEKEKEYAESRRRHGVAVEQLEKQIVDMKEEHDRKHEAIAQLSQAKASLAQKNESYSEELRRREQEIFDLKLKLAHKDVAMAKMEAGFLVEIERLKHQETEERLRQSEKERQDAQQKHRDSLSEGEELKAQLALAQLKLKEIPEGRSDNS